MRQLHSCLNATCTMTSVLVRTAFFIGIHVTVVMSVLALMPA